jgi:dihydrofolate reductase
LLITNVTKIKFLLVRYDPQIFTSSMMRYFISTDLLPNLRGSKWTSIRCRHFAVKELPWCSQSNVKPSKKKVGATDHNQASHPIQRFGIIAAMSNNNIIGLKGKLPWDIPADRKEFVRLTSGKILIMGRKTFIEQSTLSHISHAAKCIVISKSLDIKNYQHVVSSIGTEVMIVRSFLEALDLARRYAEKETSADETPNDLKCWIAGGEGIYGMSVLHPSASVMHLTVVDIDVDVSSYAVSEVAKFPPRYHWETRFTLRSTTEIITQADKAQKFTQYIYDKKRAV